MANALTGDFDVVAEFAIPAVDRVLAAMHRAERFPHSCSIRVDDNRPPGPKADPSIVGSVDAVGDATVDHNRIGTRDALLGRLSAADRLYLTLDPIVNPDAVVATEGTLVPSRLQGRAQLQMSPPTIEIPDGSGKNIRVRVNVRARYLPDPHTPRAAEFVRGEVQMTAAVNHVASQAANTNVVEIDIKAANVGISLSPNWSSQPLSPEDLAGIHQLIRNSLKTSFLPSNATLPPSIKHIQFKTLLGAQNAVAVLLNMGEVSGTPGTFGNVFLGAGDDFALAAGRDFVLAAFDPIISNMLSRPLPPVSFVIDWPWPIPNQNVTYVITLNSATADLQDGQIVLTIKGRAETGSWNVPNFDFTVQQLFSLKLVGTTAELEVGDISLDTTSWLANLFKGGALQKISNLRDQALADAQAQDKVRRMLSAEENLGKFLASLMKPPHPKPGTPPPQELKPVLTYSGFEIETSGIVLHGSLAVPDWPPAHVEFQQIPSNPGQPGGVVVSGGLADEGPDYSALKTWIPGGRIERYEWGYQGQAQPSIDVNTFVYPHGTPGLTTDGTSLAAVVPAFTPFCLTVRGKRYSSSGPVVEQPVSATACGTTRFDVVRAAEAALSGESLMLALTEPGPGGRVEVGGHTVARATGADGLVPNRIVHFADDRTTDHLEFLPQALGESRREDAPAAVLAVLTPDQLVRTRHVEGIIYAEDQAGAWGRAFGVKTARRPLTLIADPDGKVVWQHEGELDSATLVAALRKVLAAGRPVGLRLSGLSLRIGRPAPNFLFDLAPGRGLTLRKLEGRPVTLIFWTSSSKPSIQAVRDLQKATGKAAEQGPVVLAINDGEAPELAKRVAAENGLSATIVTDPRRSISLAYGVNVWPTIVFLDEFGLVSKVHYGRFAGEPVESPYRQKAAAAR